MAVAAGFGKSRLELSRSYSSAALLRYGYGSKKSIRMVLVRPQASLSSSLSGEENELQEVFGRTNDKLKPGIWGDHSASADCCHGSALVSMEECIDKIERVLSSSEEVSYGIGSSPQLLWETQNRLDILEAEISLLQNSMESTEIRLNTSLEEESHLRSLLRSANLELMSLNMYKEANEARQVEELSQLGRSAWCSLEVVDKHVLTNEALNDTHEMIQKVQESIVSSHHTLVPFKLIEILQREASFYLDTLSLATQELEQEKMASSNLHLKWQKLVEDLKDKHMLMDKLNKELTDANRTNDVLSQAVTKAEAKAASLSQQLASTESLLERERKALRAARDGLDKLEQALGYEESKVDDLFKEVSSLKGQLEQKEKVVINLTLRNKAVSESAAKHLQALHQSEKKVEQLTAQCAASENQIKSRDVLLDDIRAEAFKSTEALRLAAQIKQDLNIARQREVELVQELERERSNARKLSIELKENPRAVRAELALQQAEKDVLDLTQELSLLKKGIQARDDVIKLLEEKIEGNIQILRSASVDREAMRKMRAHIHDLELKLKDFKLGDGEAYQV